MMEVLGWAVWFFILALALTVLMLFEWKRK